MANIVSSIHINKLKETRAFIVKLKNIGLNNKGIIFGGLVRDEIIALHYKHLFSCNDLDYSEYWNKDYHPDTAKRIIIPNDMDIYFKDMNDVREFTNSLTTFSQSYNGYISNKNVDTTDTMRYVDSYIKLAHKKITIAIYIGRTVQYKGVKIMFTIDVIFPDNSNNEIDNREFDLYISSFEPPFNNLDFLCNIFIMERVNNKNVIRISNNTGTIIDSMPFSIKNQFTSKVISDIIEHKTQFVRNNGNIYNTEYINCYRILKMIDREPYNSWNITNIPFTIFNPHVHKEIQVKDKTCCICIENFTEKDNKIVSINLCKPCNVLHYNCFMDYMYAEQKKRYKNQATGCIEIRCPLRNPFNFQNCHLNVNYI